MSGEKMWLPLESNPEVMESYLKVLGVKENSFQVADVYGLDDDLLSMVPPTAVSVLMLFPLTEPLEKAIEERDAAVLADASTPKGCPPYLVPKDLYFMQQLVGNACGTIGLLHAIINNQIPTDGTECTQPRVAVEDGSFISNFMKATIKEGLPLTPIQIGQLLEKTDALDGLHLSAAISGQSELPSDDKDEEDPHNRIYHFIAFVEKDGFLWELDGRRDYPHRWGRCEAPSGMPLLKASAEAIKWFMQVDPENIQFSLTALVANSDDDVSQDL